MYLIKDVNSLNKVIIYKNHTLKNINLKMLLTVINIEEPNDTNYLWNKKVQNS